MMRVPLPRTQWAGEMATPWRRRSATQESGGNGRESSEPFGYLTTKFVTQV